MDRTDGEAQRQKEIAAANYGTSHKEQLRQTIDRVISDCRSHDDFLARMRAEGYEVKEGKLLSFRAPGWDRFITLFSRGPIPWNM